MSPLCRVGQHESFFLLPLARQKPFGPEFEAVDFPVDATRPAQQH
jgi:hypothetical protein